MTDDYGKPLTPSKMAKGGLNDAPPLGSRPAGPPPGIQSQEQAPNLEQIESAKGSLLTFCMYLYQALRQSGKSIDQAKQAVANEILFLYHSYAQLSGITFKPEAIINPMQLFDEILADVKLLGVPAKPLHNKLMDFKRLMNEEV